MSLDHAPPAPVRSLPLRERFRSALFAPVDISSLVYFRIVFGLVVAWEAWRYISWGWVDRDFLSRTFLFTYWPFDFVAPWAGWVMKLQFTLLIVAGLMIALGVRYRLAATFAFLGLTYVFLLDKALYLNHHYLVCLIAFLMIFLPAHRMCSVDVRRKPELRSRHVPGWTVWLLRFQLALPYFFAGIAKLNEDWLKGEPLRTWLAGSTDFPLIGPLFTQEPVVRGMTLGAMALDLSVVFLLVFRKTRPFGYAAAVLFHFMNARLFNIGIFPWLMIAGTAIFFPPDWPRRIVDDLRHRPHSLRSYSWWLGFGLGATVGLTLPKVFAGFHVAVGGLGGALTLFSLAELFSPLPEDSAASAREKTDNVPVPEGTHHSQRLIAILLSVWLGVHLMLPLRHIVVPGNVSWTEEGQRFAWMMLLRTKRGDMNYLVTDVSRDHTWEVDPADYLSSKQMFTFLGKPDMMLQFAHYLRDSLRAEGYDDIEIRARTAISLNGRPSRPIIDPEVDLTTVNRPWFGRADWILNEDGSSSAS